MRRILKGRRPSPALVISLIALFAALTGVAGARPGKNHVDSGDIRNNAVTGADVKESSLGRVPSAANATTAASATSALNAANATTATNATNATNAANAGAVGGNRVVQFKLIGTAPIANTKILDLDGLQLHASCPAGTVNLTATTTSSGGQISTVFQDAGDTTFGANAAGPFDVGQVFVVGNHSNNDGVGQGRYVGGDLRFVHFTYNEESSVGSRDCVLTGFAIGS